MRTGFSIGVILGWFVAPAVVFKLAYFPMVMRLSRGLVSPYAKADITRRLFAATTDGLIVALTCRLYWTSDSTLYLAAGAAYLLFRDAIRVGLDEASINCRRRDRQQRSACQSR